MPRSWLLTSSPFKEVLGPWRLRVLGLEHGRYEVKHRFSWTLSLHWIAKNWSCVKCSKKPTWGFYTGQNFRKWKYQTSWMRLVSSSTNFGGHQTHTHARTYMQAKQCIKENKIYIWISVCFIFNCSQTRNNLFVLQWEMNQLLYSCTMNYNSVEAREVVQELRVQSSGCSLREPSFNFQHGISHVCNSSFGDPVLSPAFQDCGHISSITCIHIK